MNTRSILLSFALGIGTACGSSEPPAPPPPTDPAAVMKTLTELAAFGAKRVGTPAGAQAGDYLKARFEAAGLTDVRFESFQVPRYDVSSKGLALSVDGGAATTPAVDVFEASGAGHADGDLVYVHEATDAQLTGVDLTGKIALVDRSTSYHRSTQFLNVARKGALAMLYVSAAPDNLIQVGSVRRSFESFGPIPGVTIGSVDGQALKDALGGGHTVRATIDVAATTTPATGRNVVGVIPGDDPGLIVVGAHYDTWFTGSTDNGAGVATLLALLERRVKEGKPHRTLLFIAYDGEEVALYGGYDFWRRHVVAAGEPVVAVLNFEMPASRSATLIGLAHSNVPALDDALQEAGLRAMYPFYLSMDVVPTLFGGIIPTDIQGIYRAGVPTASTASDSPWYHTVSDTPDKVDTTLVATAADTFDASLDLIAAATSDALGAHDPQLWRAQVTLPARAYATDPVVVDATVTNAAGVPQAGAPVHVMLLVDDFFLNAEMDVTTDTNGKVHVALPATAKSGWVQLSAGPHWPLVEACAHLPSL